jgi:S1-C subfamily serine protease
MYFWGAIILSFLGIGFLIPRDAPPDTSPLSAVVIIERPSGGHGSGVFISPTQILTARHVALRGDEMRVRGPEGDLYRIVGATIGPADIAILTVDRPLRVGTPLGISCDEPSRGAKLSYYGSPGDMEFIGPIQIIYVGGKIVGNNDPEFIAMSDSTLLTIGETEPGVSGSGVLNSEGKVVGVYNFAWTGTTFGGFVSLSYPAVCEWLQGVLTQGAHA